jgi:protein phosphatase
MRSNNEDSLGKREPADPEIRARQGCLYVISDGLGGHAAGEIASRMAVEAVLCEYYSGDLDPVGNLVSAIRTANHRIYLAAGDSLETEGMGCTIVACVVLGRRAIIAHVGDSRAYLWRPNSLQQLTQDHVLNVTRAFTDQNGPRNALSRAVGVTLQLDVAVADVALGPDDRVLLCTDGLTNSVPTSEIECAMSLQSPRQSVADLLSRAIQHRSRDNASVIAIFLTEGPDSNRTAAM